MNGLLSLLLLPLPLPLPLDDEDVSSSPAKGGTSTTAKKTAKFDRDSLISVDDEDISNPARASRASRASNMYAVRGTKARPRMGVFIK